MAELQGRVIAGYRLADRLSDGGIAEVYRAHSTAPGGREVVVKVIYPEFVQQQGFRARFDYIVQAAGRLRHPHILPLLGSGDQNGYLYLITPYVTAGTLRDWLKSGRRLGAHDVAPFAHQLCEAVAYAHNQGVIHGNIKPSNIYLHEGRHVLLGDFGRLWDISQLDMSHGGPGIEAVEFLAPEAFRGQVSQSSDIYSLGAVLYAGLTGRPPYTGSTPSEILNKHHALPVPRLTEMAAPLPASLAPLDDVVRRAMARAPEQRYPSAMDLAQAIEAPMRAGASRTGPGGVGTAAGQPERVPYTSFGSVPLGGASAMLFGGSPPTGFVVPGEHQPGAEQAGLPPAMAGSLSPVSAFSPVGQPSQANQAALGRASFPPTPLAGLVDPDMEEGRGGNGTGAVPAVRPGAPLGIGPAALPSLPGQQASPQAGRTATPPQDAFGDLPMQPTMRVPTSPDIPDGIAAAAGRASVLDGDGQRQPAVRPGGGAAPSASAQASASAAERVWSGDGAAESGVSAPSQPPGSPAGGFVVAGGDAQWPPDALDGAGDMSAREDVDDSRDADADYFGAWSEPGSASFRRGRPDEGMDRGRRDARDDRPFSATQLGLPSLNMPEFEEMPSPWQEIAAGQYVPYPDDASSMGEPPDRWGPSAGWSEPPDRWRESNEWREDVERSGASGPWFGGAEYSQSYDAVGGWSPESPAQESVPDLFASSSLLAMDVAPRERSRSGRRPRGVNTGQPLVRRLGPPSHGLDGPSGEEEVPGDPFADPSAWARPSELGVVSGRTRHGHAVRYREPPMRQPRRLRPLILLLLLLAILDGGLLVLVRPDLCPRNACVALHTTLSHYLPGINTQAPSATPSPLIASPAQVTMQASPGGSASATLTLTNKGKTAAAWKASSDLAWLTVSDAPSPLPPGAQVKVTLTAKPSSGLKPGTYKAKVDFTAGGTTLTLLVTVTVAAAHG